VSSKPARGLSPESGRATAPFYQAAAPAAARIPVKLHRRVCLVMTEDAVLAEELLASKKLAAEVVGRLTDRVLLIRPGRVEAVLQELQRAGHTPAVVNGPPDR
jgi:hypothetical protein